MPADATPQGPVTVVVSRAISSPGARPTMRVDQGPEPARVE